MGGWSTWGTRAKMPGQGAKANSLSDAARICKKGCVKWQLSETWTFSFVCVGFHVVANLALQLFLAGKTAHPPQPPARGVHVQRCLAKGPRRTAFQTQRASVKKDA